MIKRYLTIILLVIIIFTSTSCLSEGNSDNKALDVNNNYANNTIISEQEDLIEELKDVNNELKDVNNELKDELVILNTQHELVVEENVELKEEIEYLSNDPESSTEENKTQTTKQSFTFMSNRLRSLSKTLDLNKLIVDYQWELLRFDINDVYSIEKAFDLFKEYSEKLESLEEIDKLYYVFYDYIYAMRDYYSNSYSYEYGVDIEAENLRNNRIFSVQDMINNGFTFVYGEGARELEVDDTFVYLRFEDFVSEGQNDLNKVHSFEQNQNGGRYIIVDEALTMSWEELAERIVNREEYYNKYSNNPVYESRATEILLFNEVYFRIYLGEYQLVNSDIYSGMNSVVKSDVIDSYKEFMRDNENSRYYEPIKTFYSLLEKNEFKYHEEEYNIFYTALFGD